MCACWSDITRQPSSQTPEFPTVYELKRIVESNSKRLFVASQINSLVLGPGGSSFRLRIELSTSLPNTSLKLWSFRMEDVQWGMRKQGDKGCGKVIPQQADWLNTEHRFSLVLMWWCFKVKIYPEISKHMLDKWIVSHKTLKRYLKVLKHCHRRFGRERNNCLRK